MLVGFCVFNISTAHGMAQAAWKGAVWGAGIPAAAGIPYVITQNKGTAFEKLAFPVLLMAAGGFLGALGGGLSYVFSNATLDAQNRPLLRDMTKILYRARMCGLTAGMTAGFALISLWTLQTMYPHGVIGR